MTMGRVKINMDDPAGLYTSGRFEARYLAFLETINHLRPSLHRYCARSHVTDALRAAGPMAPALEASS